MKLCVGCGNRPEGTINIDAYPADRTQCSVQYNVHNIPNFMLATADCLPFKDKAYETVVARQVLEHLPNPLKALKEWERVCTGEVHVYVPSPYVKDLSKTHLYAWDINALTHLMEKVFPKVQVHFTDRIYEHAYRNYRTLVINLVSKLFRFYTEIEAIGYCGGLE